MHPKIPLPRGWRRRVRSSVLPSIAIPGLLDPMTNMPFLARQESLDCLSVPGITPLVSCAVGRRRSGVGRL